LRRELEQLVEAREVEQVEAILRELPAHQVVLALSRFSEENRAKLFSMLAPPKAASLVEQLPDVQAVDLIEELDPGAAAAILHELRSDEQADILNKLEDGEAEAIFAEMSPDDAQDAKALSRYPDDVAGGLMVTEYLAYASNLTVFEVARDIETHADRYRDYQVQYVFVIDEPGRLVGVLRLRDLLLARRNQVITELMIRDPLTVADKASLDDLRELFERKPFFGVPVVDAGGKLVGIVQRASVEAALVGRTGSDYLKSQGIIGGEELRSMPLLLRSRRRLSWLSINIVLNVIAASVIAAYESTLSSVIALAIFLPIISDMSGCSGTQAVAVSMRELTMGLVRPTELFRVWGKEVSVGLINGAVLGMLIGGLAWLWRGNPFLGIVVGIALAVNTVVAVSIGGIVPLLLRRARLDPALASGPILTTITDMCGFFLLLSIAGLLLSRLVGV
jgi:magnesium transporter